MGPAPNIGTRVEPFIDDWLIDHMDGVALRLHCPVAREVSFQFDQPWEGTSSIFLRVMKDGDLYRNWYRAGEDANQYPAYAESPDGIHWTRPELGRVEHAGSRRNNLLFDIPDIANVGVFRDDNPDAASSERYKAIAIGPKVNGRSTLRGLVSPDGFEWRILDTDPILVAPPDRWPMFDSPNVAFWDAIQGRYVTYVRGWVPGPPEVQSDHGNGVRSIRRSVSDDFRTWTEPEFIDMGDAPLEHLYTNACTPYFRAPHIYLMFARRFVLGRRFREGGAVGHRFHDQPEWRSLGSAIHGTVHRTRSRWRQLDRWLPDRRTWVGSHWCQRDVTLLQGTQPVADLPHATGDAAHGWVRINPCRLCRWAVRDQTADLRGQGARYQLPDVSGGQCSGGDSG